MTPPESGRSEKMRSPDSSSFGRGVGGGNLMTDVFARIRGWLPCAGRWSFARALFVLTRADQRMEGGGWGIGSREYIACHPYRF
ncbi:hypothetical protein B0T16DRAFT_101429 [Cercophora newfieldiana]|uniref:Uncharacterized protein n=1 Tax=Cercophora newfieldiana TaxID=92897 RepID=A0AA39YGW8_9PEZI|nr:hypothetical protein B0T16DRAFT_101429 [Cercophora newfieldiana]